MKPRILLLTATVLTLTATVAAESIPVAAGWEDRLTATLYAFAIADGLGAPIEKWTPEKIVAEYGDGSFTRFLSSTDPRDPPGTGKGDGRITDDVLGIEALMRAYAAQGRHLDAASYGRFYIPEIADRKVWVPERQDVRAALQRPLPQPERYAHHRNAISMVEPRQAGNGNWLNEGFNSIVFPIGAVNAGDPARAYAETIDFGSAHTESYALEAAAVTAACFAEALGPSPSVESILAVALHHAKDGTRLALEAVLLTVDPSDSPLDFARKARRAWLPYSGLPPDRLAAAEPDTLDRRGTNVGRPSRVQSIENLPASLAALKWSGGDYDRAMRAGLVYGRDAESIAAASSGLVAAMRGRSVLSAELCSASEVVNRRDFTATAREFSLTVARILRHDTDTATLPATADPAIRHMDRVAGVFASFSIGDGMAAEFETWTPSEIATRFGTGNFTSFIGPLASRAPTNPGKGDGRISDDTLEVEALMRAYKTSADHLDAYDYVSSFLPELTTRPVWIPERHAQSPAAERPLWWPERYAIHRNNINNADPRQAGQGNWLNQGLAVIIWPVGAVNAGDPDRAYAEAVAFGSAHTESYALEAAAVLAAAYAEAFGPAPSVDGVIEAALSRAQDGTRLALEAVLKTVSPDDDVLVFAEKARRAWLPYSGLPPGKLDPADSDSRDRAGTNIGGPSRIQSIESLPAALAALRWSRGDWHRALRAGIVYGHDAESISAVAASLVAAIAGHAVVPADLWAASEAANRRDYTAMARDFSMAVQQILDRDAATLSRRRESICVGP